MNLDDVFFPYLLKLFSDYQEDMEFSVEEAQAKGSQFFVEWMNTTLSDALSAVDDEEEYGDEDRTPESDAFFILSSFMQGDPEGHWIKDFWSAILLSQRGSPRYPISEMHVTYFLRWDDDKVFSFTCILPPHLLIPKGGLSDYLVTKIGNLSSFQFHEMVADRSLDLLHEVQQFKITKDSIEEVLGLAINAIKSEPDHHKRESLQNAVRFLRSAVLPPLPPDANIKARSAVTGVDLQSGHWQVFPGDLPKEDD